MAPIPTGLFLSPENWADTFPEGVTSAGPGQSHPQLLPGADEGMGQLREGHFLSSGDPGGVSHVCLHFSSW